MTDILDTAGAVASYLSSETTPADLGAQARYSMANAVGNDPSFEAELRHVAKRTGVPVDTVRAYPDDLKKQATLGAYDFDKLAVEFPNTTKFLADQDNAAVGHADTGTLTALEGAAKWLIKTPRALASAAPQSSGGMYGAAAAPFELLGIDSVGGFLRDQQKNAQGLASRVMGMDANAGFIEKSVLSGFQSAGQNLMMLPLGLANLGRVSSEAAVLGLMGVITGGQSYGKGRDAGLAPAKALAFGIQDATAEVVAEKYLGMAGFLKNVKAGASAAKLFGYELFKEIPGEIGATLWQNFNEWGNVNPDKSVGDFIAEQPEAIMQTIIATLVGGSTQIGAVKALEKITVSGQQRAQSAQLAEQHAQTLESLQTHAQASDMLKHSPETLTAFMQSLVDEGAPHVYVDSAKLVEAGIDLQALAQVVPSIASQLDQVQTGGDLVIPTGELLTGTIGSEFAQPLIDNARTDVNGMSRLEAKDYMATKGDAVNAEIERVLADKQNDAEFKAGRDAVQTQLLTQLNEVKRFTPKVNEHYATLAASFYAVMAARTGMTVQDFADRYKLGFSGQSTVGGSYDQNARAINEPVTNPNDVVGNQGGRSADDTTPGAEPHPFSGFTREQFLGNPKITPDSNAKDLVPQTYRSLESVDAVPFLAGNDMTAKYSDLSASVYNAKGQVIATYSSGDTLVVDKKYRRQGIGSELVYQWRMQNPNSKTAATRTKKSQALQEKVWDRIRSERALHEARAYQNESTALSRSADDSTPGARAARQILEAIENDNDQWATYGLRVIPGDHEGEVDAGDILPYSNNWVDGDDTGDMLDGTSAAKIEKSDEKSVLKALQNLGALGEKGPNGHYFGDRIVLVKGESVGSGEDVGETIIEDAEVVGIWKKPSKGLSEIQPNESTAPDSGGAFKQDARGQIAFGNDITQQASIISMLKGADLSTFIHEGGHFFLEVQADLATKISTRIAQGDQVSDGERSIVDDFNTTLEWMGVTATPELSALERWFLMSADEKRPHHETFARGFEAYAFEGKSPSMELTKMFQTFRAWLVNVYRAMLKSVNAGQSDIADAMKVEITDEVRGVMDRMLATSDQIAEAEAARNMGPLFQTPEEGGMDLEAYKLYHDMGTQATMDAVDQLQAKGLRDMQWLSNARSRKLKELQNQHDALRAQITQEVKAQVLSTPLYRAWTFLTAKGGDKVLGDKRVGNAKGLNPETDNLFTAIAKLGGLDREEVKKLWGIDEKEKLESGVFGTPVVRKTGGLSVDAMGQRLVEEGYLIPDEHGGFYPEKLEELFDDQRRGVDRYSIKRDMAAAYGDAPLDVPDMPEVSAGKLRTEDLRYMYGTKDDAVWRKLSALRMTSDETGMHPDVVAELFEYSSGDELVRALADAEPPKSVIEGKVDQRMLEEHGDLATPAGLERAADAAIHNDARVRFVATELRALQHAMSVRERVPGRKHTVDVLVRAAKEHASTIIARLKVREIRPSQYAAAEVRAAKAAVKAKGDLPKQAEHKRNQLINMYATKAAYAAQEEIAKAVTYFKKFDSAGVRAKLPLDYTSQIDMLLDKFELRAQSIAAVDRTKTLRTWVQSRLNAGEIPNVSEQLLTQEERKVYSAAITARDDEGNLVYPDDDERIKLLADAVERSEKRSIKDMTVEEVRGLRDTIRQIEHLGRIKDKLLTNMEGAGYAATRDLLTVTVEANAKERGKNTRTDNTWLGGKLDGLKQFGASHIKPAIWMRIFDGGVDNGPWWSAIARPANERATFETSRRAAATSRLMDILGPVLKDVSHMDKIGKGRHFPEIGTSLNWEERMAFAFNYGNESNLQRLMGGGIAGVTKALTMGQVQVVLNTLSAAEWHAVQAVWDHFETYRPEIGAKELRVNGVEPVWIDARPFSIKTSDGQTVELRGGYFPVKFDAKTSLKAQQHSDAQAAKDAMKAAYSAATTQRSFTKERVEEVTGRPLLLNLQGLYSGVNDVIHDLAWHEWVIDVNRLLRSESIDAAIREHYGANVKRELTKWRDDIVAGSARLDHGIENAAGWARRFVSSAALTYNVISALMQPLGITQSFARVGAKWVGMGLGQYLSSPIDATRMVQGKSEYMTNRTRTMFRDINELRNRVQGQTTGRELMGRYGYFLTMHFQMMVDVPTWIGAYEKGLAGGFDDKTAIALADQSVKDSQGGGEEVDQAGITRGGPMIKLFTAFYDFMNTQANVLYLKNATATDRADKFMNIALVGLVTPILAAALHDALVPGDSGDWDDWAKIVKKMLTEGLGNLIGMVAFGREFTQVAKALVGEDKGMGYAGPTGLRVIPDAYKLAKQASQGDMDDAFRKAFINFAGDLGGIPAVQINRTITGALALQEGKTSNPTAVITGYQEPH